MTTRKKNILVLGGMGFIGRNLVEELSNDPKNNLIIFDHLTQAGDAFRPGVKFYAGDFTKEEDLRKVFQENKIEVVFHLVSTTIPSNSNDNMVFDIESNLVSTLRLLDLMKDFSVPKIVFLSSGGTVYGSPEDLKPDYAFKETQSLNPICSHAIVKIAIEKYLFLYQHLYGINYLVLRLSNPYGLHHSSSKQGLINVVLRNILKGETVTVWGDGKTARDYIYVKDFAKLVRKLLEKNVNNETINIGSGTSHSINEVLSVIEKVTGKFKVEYQEARNFDLPKVVLNTDKLKTLVKMDLTDLVDGITETYEWLKQNHE